MRIGREQREWYLIAGGMDDPQTDSFYNEVWFLR